MPIKTRKHKKYKLHELDQARQDAKDLNALGWTTHIHPVKLRDVIIHYQMIAEYGLKKQ